MVASRTGFLTGTQRKETVLTAPRGKFSILLGHRYAASALRFSVMGNRAQTVHSARVLNTKDMTESLRGRKSACSDLDCLHWIKNIQLIIARSFSP